MEHLRLNELYHKNLQNTCNADEKIELETLIKNPKYAEDLERLMDSGWTLPIQADLSTESSSRIINNIINQGKSTVATRIFSWKPMFKIAAMLLVLSSIAIWIRSEKIEPKSNLEVVPVAVQTAVEHKQIKLPDGSTIILNNNSKISYAANFGKTREISLNGEGYFDIKHDASKPFIVHAGKIKITVLGTVFNVKAYQNDKKVTVTVTRGKVSVQNEVKLLGFITPNQEMVLEKNGQKKFQYNINAVKAIEWQSKDLFFDDVTMEEAAKILEQRFNVKIAFTSEAVKRCKFTGTILNAEKIEPVLNLLCSFNNSTYEINKQACTIKGTGCN